MSRALDLADRFLRPTMTAHSACRRPAAEPITPTDAASAGRTRFPIFIRGDPNWYAKEYGLDCNFISEWSYDAFGNTSLLKRVVPAAELARGPVGLDWQKFATSHPILMDRFSEINVGTLSFINGSWYGDLAKASVAEFAEYAEMAQAAYYGCVMEQWRAHFPYKGGQTVWTYNTMAPVSSWNLIDWFGQPTISFYAAKRGTSRRMSSRVPTSLPGGRAIRSAPRCVRFTTRPMV